MLAPTREYRRALDRLRRTSRSAEGLSPIEVLLRTVAVNKAAARALLRSSLRTRSQRREAIVLAAKAIAAAEPEAAE